MARGFGTTSGVAATDRLTLPPITIGPISSWAFFAYRGTDHAEFGGYFDSTAPRTGVGTTTGFVPFLIYPFSTTSTNWKLGVLPTGTDFHLGASYDGTSTSNLPLAYLNGTTTSVTGTGPTGTFVTGRTALILGNRNTGTLALGGLLWEFAWWNRILPPMVFADLARGRSPLWFPEGLQVYASLREAAYAERGQGGAVTRVGTRLWPHRSIQYPPTRVSVDLWEIGHVDVDIHEVGNIAAQSGVEAAARFVTLFTETWTAADGPLIGLGVDLAFSVISGTLTTGTVESNSLRLTNVGGVAICTTDLASTDVDVTITKVTAAKLGTGDVAYGLVAARSTNNYYWLYRYAASSAYLLLFRVAGGVPQQVGAILTPLVSPETVGLSKRGNAILATRNGVVMFEYRDPNVLTGTETGWTIAVPDGGSTMRLDTYTQRAITGLPAVAGDVPGTSSIAGTDRFVQGVALQATSGVAGDWSFTRALIGLITTASDVRGFDTGGALLIGTGGIEATWTAERVLTGELDGLGVPTARGVILAMPPAALAASSGIAALIASANDFVVEGNVACVSGITQVGAPAPVTARTPTSYLDLTPFRGGF